MSIQGIYRRDVITVGPEATVAEVAGLMRTQHVGDVIVVEHDARRRPIGIVTDRDLVVEVLAQEVDPEELTAADVMSRDLVSVGEDEGILRVIRVMRDYGHRRLPVVNAAGALVGVLSMDDVFRLMAVELSALASISTQERLQECERRS